MDRTQTLDGLAAEIVRKSGALNSALRNVIVDEVMDTAHLLPNFANRKQEYLAIDEQSLWLFTLMLYVSSALDNARVSEADLASLMRSCMAHYERAARYQGGDYSAETVAAIEEQVLLNLTSFRQNLSKLQTRGGSTDSSRAFLIFIMMYLRQIHSGFLAVASELQLTGSAELTRRFGLTFINALLADGPDPSPR